MRFPIVLGMAGLLYSAVAAAQSDRQPSWQLQLGALSMVAPAYPGAIEDRLRVVPLVALEVAGRLYAGQSRSGLDVAAGGYLHQSPNVRWMAEVGSYLPRAYRDADALAGMDRMRTRAFAGTGVAYALGPLEASASLAAALRSSQELLGTLGLAAAVPVAPAWLAQVSASASFGDRANVAAEYGVTEAEAVRRRELLSSGDARLRTGDDRPYVPRAGMKELSAQLTLLHPLSRRVSMLAFGRVGQLQGDASRSPLMRSRTTASSGVGLVYAIAGH